MRAELGRRARRAALALLALLCAATGALAAPQALAGGVLLVPGGISPGRQPDGNSVVFPGPDGVVVVDTGRHIEHTRAVLAAVGPRRLAAVVNTHWHLDHLGGNLLLRRERPDVLVYASAAVGPALGGWLARSRREMQALLDDPKTDATTRRMLQVDVDLVDAGMELRPDVVVTRGRDLTDGGQRLRLGVQHKAVTDADLWVLDPRSRVLAAGDLVTLPVPFFDTACPARWSAALERLEQLDFDQLVPGHGPVMGRDDLLRYRGAFDALLACAASPAPAAECAAGWIRRMALPERDHAAARGMLGYYLSEHLRAAPAQRDAHC